MELQKSLPCEKAIKDCVAKKCRKKVSQRSVMWLVAKYIYYDLLLEVSFSWHLLAF